MKSEYVKLINHKYMKKLRFLPLICLFTLMQIVVFSCKDDEIEAPEEQKPEETPVEIPEEMVKDSSGVVSGHVYVDLGLSVKWANCNLGAEKSYDYGDYYMWGYTTPWKEGSTWEKLDRTGGYGFRILLPKYDAATVNWGSDWRIPTNDEISELIKNCKWTWTSNYRESGISGYIVSANNGNSIFLPAAGNSKGKKGEMGYYWDSYVLSSTTEGLTMDKDKYIKDVLSSSVGMSIRPVVATEKPIEIIRDSTGIISNHVYVDLGLSVKWANCNLGAQRSVDYGDYYMWGYTTPWSGESWQGIDRTGEGLRILIPEYDAAIANWGEDWRMPTNDELRELMDKCKWSWTPDFQKTGVAGYVVTAENGNSIFLPAAGCSNGDKGNKGYYWDSYVLGPSDITSTAEGITIDDFKYIKDMMHVNVGRSIRPVVNETKDTGVEVSGTVMSHDYVDLGLSVKWATCNIGSSTTAEYGDYFAWGFHIPWNEDAFDQYFYWIDFCGDDYYLDQRFDMAATSWGKAWRLPTDKECQELLRNCDWRWIPDYKNTGTVGYLGKSQKNGNYIFLPAGGKMSADGIKYSTGEGYYWSSYLFGSQYSSLSAHGFKFVKGLRDDNFETRYTGLSVRAVVADVNNTEYVNKDVMLNLDGSKPEEDANETSIQGVTVNGKYGNHTYVDLGLPSRTLWATYNVGGSSTDSKGNYYAWGETESRDYYKDENYKFFGGFDELTDNMIMSKYNTNKTFGQIDKKTVLDAVDDAATQNMGSDWRMPTKKEMEELLNACAWKTTTINGVFGHLGVSKINRNKIFLPAMDFKYMDVPQGQFVIYWTSSLYTDYSVRAFAFTSGDAKTEVLGWGRHQGIPVRAVVNRKLQW